MTQLVAQSVINQFFDGAHSDPFSVLGMHETDNGIEIRALLPDACRVSVIDKENQDTVCELDCLDDRGFLPVLCRKPVISLPINCKCIGVKNRKSLKTLIVIIQ